MSQKLVFSEVLGLEIATGQNAHLGSLLKVSGSVVASSSQSVPEITLEGPASIIATG